MNILLWWVITNDHRIDTHIPGTMGCLRQGFSYSDHLTVAEAQKSKWFILCEKHFFGLQYIKIYVLNKIHTKKLTHTSMTVLQDNLEKDIPRKFNESILPHSDLWEKPKWVMG